MVHWPFRRPQFFICWSSLLPAVVEGRKVRMQFLAGISSISTTAKHPVWGGPPHLDRERTDSITTLGYLTLALTGSLEAAGHAMLVEGDEEANHYFIVGLGCEVVLFFDFLSSNFRMYSGVVLLIGYGNWSGLPLLKTDITLNKHPQSRQDNSERWPGQIWDLKIRKKIFLSSQYHVYCSYHVAAYC